jgi:hypothetical protein
MKYLPILLVTLLAACNGSPQPIAQAEPVQEARVEKPEGCLIDTSSRLVNQRKVSDIMNLTKEEVANGWENKCTVHFDITVDGKSYHLDESEKGLEQMASICYYAKEKARENLLLDLGGEFKTEAKIDCVHRDRG